MRGHLTIALVLITCVVSAQAVTIETVPVGNPGNAADTRYAMPGYGAVSYEYQISKFEVTAGQYCEFLNAVAKTDTYGLYSTNMDTTNNSYGCNIKRTGSLGTYTYTVASDWANRPVNYVSWGDAARFSNWLSNGQPTGPQNASTTEDGSYYLNGATSNAALLAVTRKASATWTIPSEDEWYKAAYHKNDSVTGNYWDYPTGSNDVPSNQLPVTDPGNNANYSIWDGSNWHYAIGEPYWRTSVGEFENSESPYGTFDQGGNVWEWNEAVPEGSSARGRRGGSYGFPYGSMKASYSLDFEPALTNGSMGFRVVYVPEPATLGLMALASVGILRRRTR